MKQFTDLYAETAKSAMFTIGYGSVDGKFMLTTHTTDQQGGVSGWGSFTVDGPTAVVRVGDRQLGVPGKIVMGRVDDAEQCILLNANTCTARLGGRQAGHGKLLLRNVNGSDTVTIDAETGNLTLGGSGQDGDVTLKNASGAATIVMNGTNAELTMGGNGGDGDIRLFNADGNATIVLDAGNASLGLGGSGTNGDITIKDQDGRVTALIDSDGNLTLGGVGSDGDIHIKNSCDVETIAIAGESGDIWFKNADIAEEFDVSPAFSADVVPGTVVVLDDDGRLAPCAEAYDGRVVGVVAGGGSYRPGIVLDRRRGDHRRAVAMVGKVFCRVDACAHPVRVGDLLTTSARPGHAMRVADRARAFGSIIGKALAPLADGSGLIPVLVKPQ